jgi:hypothetical protein
MGICKTVATGEPQIPQKELEAARQAASCSFMIGSSALRN